MDLDGGVVIMVTENDVIPIHQNLDALKDIVAAELNALCQQEPDLCCRIINTVL